MKGSRNSLKMSNDKMMVCGVVVVLILVGLYFLVTNNNLLEGFHSSSMELNHITSMKVLSKADLENGFKLTEYFIKKNLQPIKKVKLDPFFRSRSSVFSLDLS